MMMMMMMMMMTMILVTMTMSTSQGQVIEGTGINLQEFFLWISVVFHHMSEMAMAKTDEVVYL
jgi:hypothetical protein